MDGFTILDAGIAVVIVLSGILAYSRGLVRELMAIVGWVAAAVVAFMFAGQAAPLIRQIPILGDFIGDSCELAMIAGFAAVFAVALVIAAIFTPLMSGLVRRSALGGIDQGSGFFFGVLRGILLVAVGFFVYETLFAAQAIAMVDQSQSASIFGQLTDRIAAQNPEQALGWITGQYQQLVGSCGVAQ
jgi:membrane protein required for colicin V production